MFILILARKVILVALIPNADALGCLLRFRMINGCVSGAASRKFPSCRLKFTLEILFRKPEVRPTKVELFLTFLLARTV